MGNERGSAMLISLAVLLMLGVVGIAAIQSSRTDMDIAGNYRSDVRSFYTAEAGVEQTYAVLRDSIDWRDGFANQPFDGGTFSTTIQDSLDDSLLVDTVVVTSTGTRTGAMTTIEVRFAPLEPFGYAAFADDYFLACGGTMTDSYNSDSGSYAATQMNDFGDIGSNGFVDVCGTSVINGDASTSSPGELTLRGGAIVQDTTSMAPVVVLDPVPQADIDYALANSNAPAGLTGDYSYNAGSRDLLLDANKTMTLASGVYYFRKVTLKGSVELEPGASVKIYITGNTVIESHAQINHFGSPKHFLIFGTGDRIDIAGGAEIRAALYAPDTKIYFAGSADLYGSFVAQFAEDLGGSHFHYDRALMDIQMSGILQKVAWREL
jgi:hypothetical protein